MIFGRLNPNAIAQPQPLLKAPNMGIMAFVQANQLLYI